MCFNLCLRIHPETVMLNVIQSLCVFVYCICASGTLSLFGRSRIAGLYGVCVVEYLILHFGPLLTNLQRRLCRLSLLSLCLLGTSSCLPWDPLYVYFDSTVSSCNRNRPNKFTITDRLRRPRSHTRER